MQWYWILHAQPITFKIMGMFLALCTKSLLLFKRWCSHRQTEKARMELHNDYCSFKISSCFIPSICLKAMTLHLKKNCKLPSLTHNFWGLGFLDSCIQGFLQTIIRNNFTAQKNWDSHELFWLQKTKCEKKLPQNHDKTCQFFSSVFFF